jgi:hypothetical protein
MLKNLYVLLNYETNCLIVSDDCNLNPDTSEFYDEIMFRNDFVYRNDSNTTQWIIDYIKSNYINTDISNDCVVHFYTQTNCFYNYDGIMRPTVGVDMRLCQVRQCDLYGNPISDAPYEYHVQWGDSDKGITNTLEIDKNQLDGSLESIGNIISNNNLVDSNEFLNFAGVDNNLPYDEYGTHAEMRYNKLIIPATIIKEES